MLVSRAEVVKANARPARSAKAILSITSTHLPALIAELAQRFVPLTQFHPHNDANREQMKSPSGTFRFRGASRYSEETGVNTAYG